MSFAAIDHARTIKNRLRNPPNAVPDNGIDLKRIPITESVPVSTVVVFGPIVKPFRTVDDEAFGPITHKMALTTTGRIIDAVSQHYGIGKADILSPRRLKEIIRPRHVCMYLCRMLTLGSLPEIGRRIGRRDHTTVLFAVRKIEAKRQVDAELEADLQSLSMQICGSPLRAAFPTNEARHASPQPAA